MSMITKSPRRMDPLGNSVELNCVGVVKALACLRITSLISSIMLIIIESILAGQLIVKRSS